MPTRKREWIWEGEGGKRRRRGEGEGSQKPPDHLRGEGGGRKTARAHPGKTSAFTTYEKTSRCGREKKKKRVKGSRRVEKATDTVAGEANA